MSCCLMALASVRLKCLLRNLVRFGPTFEELLEGESLPALIISQGCFTHASVVSINEVIELIKEDRNSKTRPNFERTKRK